MFFVKHKPIIESIHSILLKLRIDLAAEGIKRFSFIKNAGENVQISCPIHKGGQERRPSCGVRAKEGSNVEVGQVHCFSCGYKATLSKMISDCFGIEDEGQYGDKWLLRNFVSVEIIERPELVFNFKRGSNNKTINYVPEAELDTYRYYHDYMYERGLTDELIREYDIGYDHTTECITFPVRDLTGGTLFVARRSVRTKWFNYPSGVEKPLYGIYELSKYKQWEDKPTRGENGLFTGKTGRFDKIIICESMINALTCRRYGDFAVATNGARFSGLQLEQLKKLPTRKYVIGFDADFAGRSAAKVLQLRLGKKFIVHQFMLPKEKDINDLSEEEYKSLRARW